MIKIIITLSDNKAEKQYQCLNEYNLIEQNKDAINYINNEFKKFLKDKLAPMQYNNSDCGLKITWCK